LKETVKESWRFASYSFDDALLRQMTARVINMKSRINSEEFEVVFISRDFLT
jgi:hypothetical protein